MDEKKGEPVKFTQILASLHFWASLFLVSALLFPLAVLLWLATVIFDRKRSILHRATCIWANIILGLNPYWKVQVDGRDKIDPSKVYVMVSNHQSGVDILVLFKLNVHFKWVAKKSLFAIPFIGWQMGLNGYIPIERARGRSKLQMMERTAASIREGNSVIMFPEGTRSPDGTLQPYKSGAFRLAIETRTPVLPVVIKGTHVALKKSGLLICPNGQIRLVILDPIPYDSFSHMDSKELAQKVYHMTIAELDNADA